VDELLDRGCMVGLLDEWIDGWGVRWMDGWVDGYLDGWILDRCLD
jgi:hypothetical protein